MLSKPIRSVALLLLALATIPLSMEARARCQAGTDGAPGEQASSGDPNGGDGESVSCSETFDTSKDVNFQARGGDGGDAHWTAQFDTGASGGDGGDASADIIINPTAFSGRRTIDLESYGGRGGHSYSRLDPLAKGGDAGQSQIDVSIAEAPEEVLDTLEISAFANSGRPGRDGLGGVDNSGSSGRNSAEFSAESLNASRAEIAVGAGSPSIWPDSGDYYESTTLGASAAARVINTGDINLTVGANGRTRDQAFETVEIKEAYAESTGGGQVSVTTGIGDDRTIGEGLVGRNLGQGKTTGHLILDQSVINQFWDGAVASHMDYTNAEASRLTLVNEVMGRAPEASTRGISENGADVRVSSRQRVTGVNDDLSLFTDTVSGRTSGRLSLEQIVEIEENAYERDLTSPTISRLTHDQRGMDIQAEFLEVRSRAVSHYGGIAGDPNPAAHAKAIGYGRSVDVRATASGGYGLSDDNPYSSWDLRTPSAPGIATIEAYGEALDPLGDATVRGTATSGFAGDYQDIYQGGSAFLNNAVDGKAGGTLRLFQTAIAGRGYVPGSAVSYLDKTSDGQSLELEVTAEAGGYRSPPKEPAERRGAGNADVRAIGVLTNRSSTGVVSATGVARPSDHLVRGEGAEARSETAVTRLYGNDTEVSARAVGYTIAHRDTEPGRDVTTSSLIGVGGRFDFDKLDPYNGSGLSVHAQAQILPDERSLESGLAIAFPDLHAQFFPDDGSNVDILGAGLLSTGFETIGTHYTRAMVSFQFDYLNDFGYDLDALGLEPEIGFGMDFSSLNLEDYTGPGPYKWERMVIVGLIDDELTIAAPGLLSEEELEALDEIPDVGAGSVPLPPLAALFGLAAVLTGRCRGSAGS